MDAHLHTHTYAHIHAHAHSHIDTHTYNTLKDTFGKVIFTNQANVSKISLKVRMGGKTGFNLLSCVKFNLQSIHWKWLGSISHKNAPYERRQKA